MPLIILIVFLLNILSVAVLASAGWLGWTWYTGFLIEAPNGDFVRAREDWRLWLALGLLAWSFLGRYVVLARMAWRSGHRPNAVTVVKSRDMTAHLSMWKRAAKG